MGFGNSSQFYQRQEEINTTHATQIAESDADKLYNSIARIEKEDNSTGTGFFM